MAYINMINETLSNKFHPYSILTGDTMVRFVIFCVLSMICPTFLLLAIWKCHAKLTFASFSIKVCTFFLFTSKTPDLEETYNTLSFYQIEPYKKGPSLVLPSSMARNSSAPNAKRIFEILWGFVYGCYEFLAMLEGNIREAPFFKGSIW